MSEFHAETTDAPLVRKQPDRPPDRLASLGHAPPSRKHPEGPPALTARHQLLIEYQTSGCPYGFVSRIKRAETRTLEDGSRVTTERPLQPGEPLTLIEAADLLRIRRRNARQLSQTPIFQKALAQATQEFRDGERLRSLQTMAEIRDEPGEGLAADRKVRLQAASTLLGEDAGRKGVTVNVQANVVTPGYVIVRRSDPDASRVVDGTVEKRNV